MSSGVIVALVILVLAAVALIYLEMNSRRNARLQAQIQESAPESKPVEK